MTAITAIAPTVPMNPTAPMAAATCVADETGSAAAFLRRGERPSVQPIVAGARLRAPRPWILDDPPETVLPEWMWVASAQTTARLGPAASRAGSDVGDRFPRRSERRPRRQRLIPEERLSAVVAVVLIAALAVTALIVCSPVIGMSGCTTV